MKREEKIYLKLKELMQEEKYRNKNFIGVQAQEVAHAMGLDRGNVSKDLNELVRKGKVIKFSGRPVRFSDITTYNEIINEKTININFCTDNTSSPFDDMIGQNGSLKIQIKQAKAAMLYPPNGLHTLITGQTGTGKTTFAKKMYEYAMYMKMLKENSKFVVFNCAEYAENPQLIVSQLFGHKKGAFTGADTDKPGLIEEADGGVLFLDEIHRLPPEGQEMLFSLMDFGKYRRLGETDRNRNASVLIIGATTEDLETVLLKTFLRRMPVVIKLPSLKERPLIERLQFIELFLSSEQAKISVSLQILKDVVLNLLLYDCKGNIGQLKSDIQLLCARAFWEYQSGNRKNVELDRDLLPIYMERGIYRKEGTNSDLIKFLEQAEDSYIFTKKNHNSLHIVPECDESDLLYNVISKKYYIYNKFNNELTDLDEENIDKYIYTLIDKNNNNKQDLNNEALLKMIDNKVYYAVKEAVEFAEMKLGKKISDKIKVGFALHINAIYEGIEKIANIKEENVNKFLKNHVREVKVAKLILKILEEELNINISDEEVGFIAMFLSADEENDKFKNVGVIVIAHGDGTAKSMAQTANNLLNVEHCKWIDMPLNVSVEETYKKVVKLAKEADEGKGVLLLVDMGSLNMFAYRLKEEFGIDAYCISMVSTLMVIEATRKATIKGNDIKDIVSHLKTLCIKTFDPPNQNKKNMLNSTIVITCMSGMGAAVKIGEMVKEIAGIKDDDNIKIVYSGFDGMNEKKEKIEVHEGNDIIAVIGTNDLHLPNIPFISIDELVMGNGIGRIEEIVKGNKIAIRTAKSKENIIDKRIIVGTLKELLVFLDADKICSFAMDVFLTLSEKLNINITKECTVKFIIHTACMIERLLRKEILPYNNVDTLIKNYSREFEIIKNEMLVFEELFNIVIPNTEIAYVVEIFNNE